MKAEIEKVTKVVSADIKLTLTPQQLALITAALGVARKETIESSQFVLYEHADPMSSKGNEPYHTLLKTYRDAVAQGLYETDDEEGVSDGLHD